MAHDTHELDRVKIVHFPDDKTPMTWHQPVLALGNFDGVHRGHAKIIDRVRRRADERGVTAVALTFDPHPSRIVRPDKAPRLLMTHAQKIAALTAAGMEGIAVVRFTPQLSRWEPEAFVRSVLVGVAACRRGLGRRELPVRSRPYRELLAAAVARGALRLPGRKDRPGAVQGVRGQQHTDQAPDHRRAGRRSRRAARTSLHARGHGDPREGAWAPNRVSDRESVDRQRVAPPQRRVCHGGADRRRDPRVGDQRRRSPHVRDVVWSSVSSPTCSTSTASCMATRSGSRSSGGCGTK